VIRHALAPVVPRAAEALKLPRRLPGSPGVALTFDDGPHPEGTPAVLEVLAHAGARATFFLVGEQVERRPALAAEIVAAGHLVAVHGYRHRLQLRLGRSDLADDLERGAAAVQNATAVAPRWHRPPYGIYSAEGLRATTELGLRPLLWSLWGKDWRKHTTAARIARRATHGVQAGDVILLHDADYYSARDSHQRTVQALPAIIAELKLRKLDTVLPV
jgi:peptidoglycan-N-acetylglucosamine deacetylase